MQRNLCLSAGIVILHNSQDVIDGVAAIFNSFDNGAIDADRNHGTVFNQTGFRAGRKDFAFFDLVAHLNLHGNIPFLVCIQRRNAAAFGNEGALFISDLLQRTLNTIIDIAQNARSQYCIQQIAGTDNFLTWLQAGRGFIYLNHDSIIINTDDFTKQFLFTDIDHLTHGKCQRIADRNDGPIYRINDITHAASSLSSTRKPEWLRNQSLASFSLSSSVQLYSIPAASSRYRKPPISR